ncbi:hypothetical protein NIES298_37320 [Microcystis aeruginosa NIES-298]|nr:hypothetical protein NIES298_37320 [Microcystis aeruginosa NIES-298]
MQGVPFTDGAGMVGGVVADFVDGANFAEKSRFKVIFKGLLVDESA